MSTAILRHHSITLSFLPYKRDRQLTKSIRTLRIRTSRRHLKQIVRCLITRKNHLIKSS